MGKNNEDSNKTLKGLGLASQIGFSTIVPILIGVYIGRFLDEKMGTRSIFSIIFIILGAILGFIALYKISSHDNTKKEKK